MSRPKLHSDEEVLRKAKAVLLQEGPAAFTLSDVAKAVGMSRAALIQRFQDKATIHRRIMEELTKEVREFFASSSGERHVQSLWTFLRDMITGMDAEVGEESYLLLFWGDIVDPHLCRLALERNELVRKAIAARMPPTPHDPERASGLIQSVIQGSYMRWMVCKQGRLSEFMVSEVHHLLTVLYPDETLAH
ncbi:TetR/AcrR family transcriptional regulator [Ciceribacter sp. RN22]|uniref:TetR/AcrR family transcriptional regulator n=1 Tax=Ciceribacter sp. RN22 TaxID=2954932 RepID=UPI00209257BD|nr:TetR/AcrR family transcriptional regulator [Ciceribacter sp. RN22]MCO6179252.1 TetR/AcrR family transcriptional regulator [Ciceribacter sp. RN22]